MYIPAWPTSSGCMNKQPAAPSDMDVFACGAIRPSSSSFSDEPSLVFISMYPSSFPEVFYRSVMHVLEYHSCCSRLGKFTCAPTFGHTLDLLAPSRSAPCSRSYYIPTRLQSQSLRAHHSTFVPKPCRTTEPSLTCTPGRPNNTFVIVPRPRAMRWSKCAISQSRLPHGDITCICAHGRPCRQWSRVYGGTRRFSQAPHDFVRAITRGTPRASL